MKMNDLKLRTDGELNSLKGGNVIEKVLFFKWDKPILPAVKSNGRIRTCDFSATVNMVIKKAV